MMKANQFFFMILVSQFFIIFLLIKQQNVPVKTSEQIEQPKNDNLKELLKDIFTVSPEQKLIKPEAIVKTIKFMIEDVEQDDPELLKFVQSLIVPPSKGPRVLKNKTSDKSQFGQSKYIDSLLNKKEYGFFIEAGGYNGESLSNSLFFEIERKWSGLLIEPIPTLYQALVSKKRSAYAINACIADKKPFVAKFRLATTLSGQENLMRDSYRRRMDMRAQQLGTGYVYVPCFSLYTILKAIDVSDVDYFSLDVEGAEWHVIQSIPFDKINIKTFTIEWPGSSKELIMKRLRENNFELLKDDGTDIYLKNSKFL